MASTKVLYSFSSIKRHRKVSDFETYKSSPTEEKVKTTNTQKQAQEKQKKTGNCVLINELPEVPYTRRWHQMEDQTSTVRIWRTSEHCPKSNHKSSSVLRRERVQPDPLGHRYGWWSARSLSTSIYHILQSRKARSFGGRKCIDQGTLIPLNHQSVHCTASSRGFL